MRRSRKFILIALLATVVLAGSIGGVVMANDNEDTDQPSARHEAMLDRVCEIYNTANPEAPIDGAALEDAFAQARDETMTEARNQFRQRLLDSGQVTQEQLDEFEAWMETRPDDIPFGSRLRGHGAQRSFRMPGGGFGGRCVPQPAE